MNARSLVLLLVLVGALAALYFGFVRGGSEAETTSTAAPITQETPSENAASEELLAPQSAATRIAAPGGDDADGVAEASSVELETARVQMTCSAYGSNGADRVGRLPFVAFMRTGPLTREVLYRGRTEVDGTALFELSFPRGTSGEVWVAPDERGIQARAFRLVRVAEAVDFDYQCRVRVVLGDTIFGALVRADGSGVQGEAGVPRKNDESRWARSAKSREDGGFDLHLQEALVRDIESGRAWAITAEAPGIGTGHLDEQGLEDEHPLLPRTITVSGGAEVRGRLVDANGVALPGVEVRVARNEASLVGDAESGLREDTVESDSDGRFAVSGLAPGRYDIDATVTDGWKLVAIEGSDHLQQVRDRQATQVTDEPVAADGVEREYTLDLRLLIVSLMHANGEVYTGDVDLWHNRLRGESGVAGIPYRPRLRVRTAEDEGQNIELRRLDDGRFVSVVSGMDTAFVRVFGAVSKDEGFAPLTTQVDLAGESSIASVSLEAESPPPYGTLEIDAWVTPRARENEFPVTTIALDPADGVQPATENVQPRSGWKLGPRQQVQLDSGPRIVLIDALTKREVLEVGQGNIHGPEASTVPAGDYFLRITPRRNFGDVEFGGASTAVTVRRGETSRVSLEIGPGATIRLSFDGAEGDYGRLYLEDTNGVRFDLVGPPPPMRVMDSFTPRPSETFSAGVVTETLPLPAGAFRLRGRIGAREVDVPVTLRDGECLDVKL